MKLVIAEKPSLATHIRGAVGVEFTVTNAFGHIYELAGPDDYLQGVPKNAKTGKPIWRAEDLPVVPNVWKKHPKPDARERVAKIKLLLKNATEVINAGDPDREGQLLIDEIVEELGFKGTVTRVWLPVLTDDAIRTAFANRKPNNEYRRLSDSASARSHADWLVGMNLTRAWTIKNRGLISVGRVQSPTLALIVNRDNSIDKFKSRDFFEVHAKVSHQNGTFMAKWKPVATDVLGFDEEGRLIDRKLADTVCTKATGAGRVSDYKSESKKRGAPLPFSLSSLQKTASAKLGLGAKQVLDMAQELYEAKLTSYPRTDCPYLNTEQAGEVFSTASKLARKYNVTVTKVSHVAFNNSKVTAHTALVPTGEDASGLTGNKAALYDLIAKSVVALFMPPQEYISANVSVALGGEHWVASGKRVTSAGWTAIYGKEADDEDEKGVSLPDMKTGDEVRGLGGEVRPMQTKPPARFSEGTLIEAMSNIHRFVTNESAKAKLKETSGIGTEATRANVIEVLKKREWVVIKGKNIISTDSGKAVIGALPHELTDPVTTALWEDKLSDIASGVLTVDEFESEIVTFVRDQLTLVGEARGAVRSASANSSAKSTESVVCPICGGSIRRMESKKKAGVFFWACESRDHGLLGDDKGKPGKPFGNKT